MRYGRSLDKKNSFDDDFDKDIRFIKFWGILAGIVSLAVSLGVLAFLGWVIVMLMKYFNVI